MTIRALLLGLLSLLPLAGAARGQDPGVPGPGYVLAEEGELTVEHTPGSAGTAARAAALFLEARAAVEERLGVALPPRPHLVIAPGDAEFSRRFEALAGEPAPPHYLAVALPDRGLVMLRQSGLRVGSEGSLEATLRHELAHLALGAVERRGGRRLPQWLNEGLCEWAAGRQATGEEESSLASWARYGHLPRWDELEAGFPPHGGESARAYLAAFAFVRWLEDRRPGAVRALVGELSGGATVDAALRATLGEGLEDLDLGWRLELSEEHSLLRALLWSVPLWGVIGLLALVAAVVQGLRYRRARRELLLAELDAPAPAVEQARDPDPLEPGPASQALPPE